MAMRFAAYGLAPLNTENGSLILKTIPPSTTGFYSSIQSKTKLFVQNTPDRPNYLECLDPERHVS